MWPRVFDRNASRAVDCVLAHRFHDRKRNTGERVSLPQQSIPYLLPQDLNITVTRNYGETAKDKSDELLKHLFIATLSVTLLIALALGWRE